MYRVVAIVKPFRAQAVLEAIAGMEVDEIEICEVRGYGRQKDRLPLYVEGEYSLVYLPKIEISLVISEAQKEQVLGRIAEIARTGRIGDGKVLVLPVLADIGI